MSEKKQNSPDDEDSVCLGNPNQPGKPVPFTPEAWKRILAEAARHGQLNQEQCPRPYPQTPDEEILARLD
jgi:hypothetical protein